MRPLPPAVVDRVVAVFGRITIPSLRRYGLPRPSRGAYTAVLRDHVLPILDVGSVAAIVRGGVRPVPAVASFESDSLVLADGQRGSPDAVIASTGFRPGLEPIVGHLGVLDADGVPQVHGPAQHPSAPGIFFLGHTNAVSGTCARAPFARAASRTCWRPSAFRDPEHTGARIRREKKPALVLGRTTSSLTRFGSVRGEP